MPVQVWSHQCGCRAPPQIPIVWRLEDRVHLWIQLALEQPPEQSEGQESAGSLLQLPL